MKYFRENYGTYNDKVNFIDENNVVLGYDMAQDCCEEASWFISEYPEVGCCNPVDRVASEYSFTEDEINEVLTSYIFDVDYFQKHNWHDLDEGGAVSFKLKSTEGKQDLYLYIYNSHNGFYGHGFSFRESNEFLHEGLL